MKIIIVLILFVILVHSYVDEKYLLKGIMFNRPDLDLDSEKVKNAQIIVARFTVIALIFLIIANEMFGEKMYEFLSRIDSWTF